MLLSHSRTPSYQASLNRWRSQNNRLLPRWLPTWLYQFGVSWRVCDEHSATPAYTKHLSWSCYSPKWSHRHTTDTQGSALAASQVENQGFLITWTVVSVLTNRNCRSSSHTRSADTRQLAALPSRTKIGARDFRYTTPSIQNNIPVDNFVNTDI